MNSPTQISKIDDIQQRNNASESVRKIVAIVGLATSLVACGDKSTVESSVDAISREFPWQKLSGINANNDTPQPTILPRPLVYEGLILNPPESPKYTQIESVQLEITGLPPAFILPDNITINNVMYFINEKKGSTTVNVRLFPPVPTSIDDTRSGDKFYIEFGYYTSKIAGYPNVKIKSAQFTKPTLQ